VARRRPQYYLADLVAIVALSGLGLALLRSFEQPGSFVAIFILLWLVGIAWTVSRVMRDAPTCEECGRRFMPPRQKRLPRLCPQCGEPQLSAGRSRKALANGFWAVLVALVLLIVVLVRFVPVDWAGSAPPSMSWLVLHIALPLVPVLLLALFLVLFFARFLKDVVRSGLATVWYSGPTNPVPLLMEQMETTRSRLESLLGKAMVGQPPPRILCFRKRIAFQAFLTPLLPRVLNWLKSLDGVYIRRPYRILTLCTDEVPYRVLDRDKSATVLFCSYFVLEISPANPPATWFRLGISKTLTSDRDDRARLNRKILVALSKGTAPLSDLFKLNDNGLVKLLEGWNNRRDFERLEQFTAESWSVCEYLGGDEAPAERRHRFRAFLNDNPSKEQPEEVFKRHFGFGFGGLVESWREWVQEQGIGTFAPLPRFIQDGLRNRVIPCIKDRQANREDRILAIRCMGIGGYALGADALIGLLKDDEAIPREEIVWALEAISGMAYGDDPDRWADWWSSHSPT